MQRMNNGEQSHTEGMCKMDQQWKRFIYFFEKPKKNRQKLSKI